MPEVPAEERALTFAQVAALFRVDPKTVSRWVTKGMVVSFMAADGTRRFPAGQFAERLRGEREGAGGS